MVDVQQTDVLKPGTIVQFTKYSGLEEGVDPILKEGEHVTIMKISADKDGRPIFEVRPVGDNGKVMAERDGDMLFDDEFALIEATAAKKAPAKKATKAGARKVTTAKRGGTKEPAAEVTEVEQPAGADAKAAGKKAAAKKATAPKKAPAKQAAEPEAQAEVKPVPKATTSKRGAMVSPEGYTHDPEVAKLVRKSNDIIEVARTLNEQTERVHFKLGGVLAKIKEDGLHKEAGFDDTAKGFDEYVTERIGGFGRRTAYYLIKTYRHFCEAKITSDMLESIGWTKARELTGVRVEDLDEEWLEAAKTLTRDDLKARIKSTYVNAEDVAPETIRKTKYTFTLIGDANSLVEQALNRAKEQAEGGDANAAFELICTEWLTQNQDVEGAATALPQNSDQLVEYAAERLGLEVDVVGPVDGDAAQAGEAQESE